MIELNWATSLNVVSNRVCMRTACPDPCRISSHSAMARLLSMSLTHCDFCSPHHRNNYGHKPEKGEVSCSQEETREPCHRTTRRPVVLDLIAQSEQVVVVENHEWNSLERIVDISAVAHVSMSLMRNHSRVQYICNACRRERRLLTYRLCEIDTQSVETPASMPYRSSDRVFRYRHNFEDDGLNHFKCRRAAVYKGRAQL